MPSESRKIMPLLNHGVDCNDFRNYEKANLKIYNERLSRKGKRKKPDGPRWFRRGQKPPVQRMQKNIISIHEKIERDNIRRAIKAHEKVHALRDHAVSEIKEAWDGAMEGVVNG